jgi:hypothetical protein
VFGVDAVMGTVTIANAISTATATVAGALSANSVTVGSSPNLISMSNSGSIDCIDISTGMATVNQDLSVTGTATLSSGATVTGGVSATGAVSGATASFSGATSAGSLTVTGSSLLGSVTVGSLSATGAIETAGQVSAGNIVCTGTLTVANGLVNVTSTDVEIADARLDLAFGGSKTTAAHRTTVQAGGVALAFGGYDDSEDSDTRKSLGEFAMSVGATAAADKFTASHQLQAPSFRIGTNDLNYVVLTYDDTNNQFVVTRKKSGSADVSNPITFA